MPPKNPITGPPLDGGADVVVVPESATPAAASTDEEPAAIATTKMVRNFEQFSAGPHAADVHPDEVENWKAHGWTVAK